MLRYVPMLCRAVQYTNFEVIFLYIMFSGLFYIMVHCHICCRITHCCAGKCLYFLIFFTFFTLHTLHNFLVDFCLHSQVVLSPLDSCNVRECLIQLVPLLSVGSHGLVLYNILLPINLYSGSITTNAIAKTMSDIRISYGYFIRFLGHCISP